MTTQHGIEHHHLVHPRSSHSSLLAINESRAEPSQARLLEAINRVRFRLRNDRMMRVAWDFWRVIVNSDPIRAR